MDSFSGCACPSGDFKFLRHYLASRCADGSGLRALCNRPNRLVKLTGRELSEASATTQGGPQSPWIWAWRYTPLVPSERRYVALTLGSVAVTLSTICSVTRRLLDGFPWARLPEACVAPRSRRAVATASAEGRAASSDLPRRSLPR
jgi:hypothetical protein